MAVIEPAGPDDRADAAAFAGRVARWDPMSPIRMRGSDWTVGMWARTPFDVLVTRSVSATVTPNDVTVRAANLLAALAVATDARADPGPVIDELWRSQLPPADGWVDIDDVPAAEVLALADSGVSAARAAPDSTGGAPTSLLDSEVLVVTGAGLRAAIPMRMLFALSGMGFASATAGESVRVRAADAWIRIDARFGAVVRRKHRSLRLLV